MAQKDLIPLNKRTKEEQKKITQKGGIKSGQVRREKKTIQNLLNDLLNNPCKDNPQFAKIASKLG